MNKTMKKRLFFLLIVAALFLVSGCAVKTITNEAGETVTKLIYTTTTFKETFDTENFFNALLVWPMAQVINHTSPVLGVAGAILSIAGLSFLGLGIQPPTPEWGAMLSNARTYIRDSWHITVIPGAAIMLTILALNVIGDGLRDALDPKLKN